MKTHTVEPFDISLKTAAGQLSTSVEVPTGFVPIVSIVPLLHRLGDAAQALVEQETRDAGRQISCGKGCAACCRMLVPVSAPEAFALKHYVLTLPEERRHALMSKLADTHVRLQQAGLLDRLMEVAEDDGPRSDDELEPINQDYYALRLPCPFLENECCSIYDHRPSACRELLVTTPPELCLDLAHNPVQPLPVSIRMSTALAMLWSDLTASPGKLIPLPIALLWADRHTDEHDRRWPGMVLLEKALDQVGRFLSQALAYRSKEQ